MAISPLIKRLTAMEPAGAAKYVEPEPEDEGAWPRITLPADPTGSGLPARRDLTAP